MIAALLKFLIGTALATVLVWCYFVFLFDPKLSLKLGKGSELELRLRDGWTSAQMSGATTGHRDLNAKNTETGQILLAKDGIIYIKDDTGWISYGPIILGDVFSFSKSGAFLRDGSPIEPVERIPFEKLNVRIEPTLMRQNSSN